MRSASLDRAVCWPAAHLRIGASFQPTVGRAPPRWRAEQQPSTWLRSQIRFSSRVQMTGSSKALDLLLQRRTVRVAASRGPELCVKTRQCWGKKWPAWRRREIDSRSASACIFTRPSVCRGNFHGPCLRPKGARSWRNPQSKELPCNIIENLWQKGGTVWSSDFTPRHVLLWPGRTVGRRRRPQHQASSLHDVVAHPIQVQEREGERCRVLWRRGTALRVARDRHPREEGPGWCGRGPRHLWRADEPRYVPWTHRLRVFEGSLTVTPHELHWVFPHLLASSVTPSDIPSQSSLLATWSQRMPPWWCASARHRRRRLWWNHASCAQRKLARRTAGLQEHLESLEVKTHR